MQKPPTEPIRPPPPPPVPRRTPGWVGSILSPTALGWQCPRCKAINAPWLRTCDKCSGSGAVPVCA